VAHIFQIEVGLKVNISYAVGLEDVPIEVGKLITNAGYHISNLLDEIENIGASNPTKAVESIARVREGLADLDLRLSDCSDILAGFMDIQARVATSSSLEADEAEDAPTD
jgi:hypothetical protein